MPSPTKPAHTRLLVQVRDDVHAAADARRRRERITWSTVIATLLSRWAAGQDIEGPVRAARLLAEPPPPVVRAHEAKVPGARVEIPPERWHRSLVGALLAGTGKTVPADLPALDEDEDETVYVVAD